MIFAMVRETTRAHGYVKQERLTCKCVDYEGNCTDDMKEVEICDCGKWENYEKREKKWEKLIPAEPCDLRCACNFIHEFS